VSSNMLMAELEKQSRDVTFVNSTLRATNAEKGVFDLAGVIAFSRQLSRFIRALLSSGCSVLYLPLAANAIGFTRDMVLICTAKLFGINVVVQFWGGNYRNFYDSSGWCRRQLIARTWSLASYGIVESENLRSMLVPVAHRLEYRVIANGLPEREYPSKSLDGASPETVLLYIGHLTYTKGFNNLIRAYKELRQRHKNLRFLFAGEKPTYQHQISTFLNGPEKRIFIENYRSFVDETLEFIADAEKYGAQYRGIVKENDKRALLMEGDIFVQPSYMEGMSIVVLEAMFTGLPVVATTVGAAPEIIRNGVNGYLVDPGSIEMLVEAIDKLIIAPDQRRNMGRNNAEEARVKYSIQRFAAEVYQTVLDASYK
jgi:glycosyltransferase involved in cell wall biosynthesis